MINFFLLILFLFSSSLYSQPVKYDFSAKEDVFFDFEDETHLWKITTIKNNCVEEVNLTKEKFLSGEKSLKIKLVLPGEGSVEKDFYKDLSNYKNIIFNIYIPLDAPDDIKVCFFLQDSEWLWYQTPLFSLKKDQWNKITVNVEPGSPFWENIGHSQPWSEKTIANIRKIGIKIFSNTKYNGAIFIDDIKGTFKVFPEISINKKKLCQYEKFEVSFFLPRKYKNLFNPEEVNVEGIFIDRDEKTFIVPGFYYQDYERKIENGEEILLPVGYPYWKIRFTPEKYGRYKFYIKVKDSEGEKLTDIYYFLVEPSDNKNKFITVSQIEKNFFSFKNGDFFYPVGINIRSPTDERYLKLVKKNPEPDKGTFYYEEIFKKMNENGLNFTEIWMSPWFCALEWKENRPGYKGVGYYNLRNAWKLDKILELAEKYNIYIQLVIINHGQLSTWCDQEWDDNPYNEKNGGFLKSPDDFFTNEMAKKFIKNKLRYIVARWGCSSNIFSWEILNEINLIGSDRQFFEKREKEIELWYKEMTDYLREIDPYAHLITGHYTIPVNNKILSEIIDYTITNAYYKMEMHNLPDFLKYIYNFHSRFKKPVFVSEFGGTPLGSSPENLKRDIIIGLWFSFHLPFAGTPLFWWHRFIDEFDLFHLYKIFSEYIKDFNRLKMSFEEEKIKMEGTEKNKISFIGIGNKYFSSFFIYDNSVVKNVDKMDFSEFKNLVCFLSNKKIGRFKIEFYDLENGKIREEDINTDEYGNLKISIPSFKKWIAIKAKFNGE